MDGQVLIENCWIENYNTGLGDIGSYSDNTIRNCLFRNCLDDNAIFLLSGRITMVQNCIIDTSHNWDPAIDINGLAVHVEIENNLIVEAYRGIHFEAQFPGSFARNNTIFGGIQETFPLPGIYLGNSWPDTISAINNILSDGDIGVEVYGDTQITLLGYTAFWNNRICDIYDPGTPSFPDTIGLIYEYPMFAHPESLDFHLQAFSPLIDAGDPNILDVDGTRSDIGCYGGPGGCSYVYLDLAPLIPDSLSAAVDTAGIHLSWRNNYEADFNRYQTFRDTVSGFAPSVFNMVAEPETCFYLDSAVNQGISYYYRFTSVDNQDNVSDHSEELAVHPTGYAWDDYGHLVPRYAVIEKAYPNPFNSQIAIVYSASNLGPQPPEIKLVLYDVQGRIIRTLVDEKKPCGTYRAVWDGKDDAGHAVASGSYIARLTQWGCAAGDYPVKITLVK
jgi:hypothetical protein